MYDHTHPSDDNDQNQWPELLQFLFQCCDLQQPQLYSSALHIIRWVVVLPEHSLGGGGRVVLAVYVQSVIYIL